MSSHPPPETIEVRAAHRFDPEPLARWLAGRLPGFGQDLAIRQFRGGQSNPTFQISSGGRSWVLRKKPPGRLLPSAHAVEREHRVLAALQYTDVPVPRVELLCTDPDVIGTPFYVMEHVHGRVYWDPALPDLDPATRQAVYLELARVLAALHQVDPGAVGLDDYGRPHGYLARQTDRWTRQYRASETDTVQAMERLIAWLPANLPARDETGIAHGDYKLDNLLFHPTEPRVLAVLDWELSTLGHPLADLAYTTVMFDVRLPGLGGLAGTDLAGTGIPDERALVAAYCAAAGRDPDIEGWAVYKAFSLFRLASIAQGVYKRGLQGNASSEQSLQFGQAARVLATVACGLAGIG